MNRLQWKERQESFVAAGYRITASSNGGWRLESPGAGFRRSSHPALRTSDHRSVEEAMAWADRSETEERRRLAIKLHLALALAGLGAFVTLAEVIGSLLGLALLSFAFYVMLRSAANALGLHLHDAWGWSRAGHQRLSFLEKRVAGLARRIRSRRLSTLDSEQAQSVTPLAPLR